MAIEGQDIYSEDFIRQEQILMEESIPSDIQKFFKGSNILITGGSGFLGQILLEKLLRCCYGLNKIYLTMRPKKGKTPEERLEELFKGPVFVNLKKIRPNFQSKIVLLTADIGNDNIFQPEDQQTLIQNVHIVVHCAATVRFDETLRTAAKINVKGTKIILDLAREIKNLKAFVYVSTAFSYPRASLVEEKVYPAPLNYTQLFNILDSLNDDLVNFLTPRLLKDWPNTYAFTKSIAENTVKEHGKGLPISIFRPSIVTSTAKEPLVSWINNIYGPQGVTAGSALGILRTLHCDPDAIADLVPVDMVVNAIIALAWDLGQTKGDNPNFEKISWKEISDNNVDKTDNLEEIPVINYTSGSRNPLTWKKFQHYNAREKYNCVSTQVLWDYGLTLEKNYYKDQFYQFFCQLIPALIVDFVAIILGKKPMMFKAFKKIRKFSEAVAYFCTRSWNFEHRNIVKLWDKLSDKDKNLFHFKIEDLDWELYFKSYLKGLKLYIFKDDSDDDEAGHKKLRRLRFYHLTLVTSIWAFWIYIFWKIYSYYFL